MAVTDGKRNQCLSPSEVSDLIRYNPETGELFWLFRPRSMFETKLGWAAWNGKHAGHQIVSISSLGYNEMKVWGRKYKGHRIAWAISHGEWPEEQIDHINGDRADNRLCNLRAVNRRENSKNSKLNSKNTSGVIGVSWISTLKCWRAQITDNGKKITLKSSKNINVVIAARKEAERRLGYHENHGRVR